MIPSVAASERGKAQTAEVTAFAGLKDRHKRTCMPRGTVLGKRAAAGESPVLAHMHDASAILSKAGSETPRPKQAAPSAKAKYYRETDSEPVP